MSAKGTRTFFSIQNTPNLVIIFVLLVYTATDFSHHNWTRDKGPNRGVINWDVISYYAYLPATIIYKDLSLDFTEEQDFVNDNKFWFQESGTGKKLIITSMGMSFLYAPFFMLAHILAPVFGEPRSGFNSIYQFFLVLSSLFYAGAGLFLLRRILLGYFEPAVTALTLLFIGLGTNLYYYTTFEAAMTHSYSFFLITLFLFLIQIWYEKTNLSRSLLLGLVFGLITLVRPTNILVLLVFILWRVSSVEDFKKRIVNLITGGHFILVILAGFILVWIPQLIYWKIITGQLLYYTYNTVESRFYFGAPHIIEILLSVRKGWFFYTPIMLIAIAGLFLDRNKTRDFLLPLSVYLILMIYVQASWWTWWFGGSFGSRVFIDTYGIMALPLAALMDRTLRYRKKAVSVSMPLFMILLLFYQVFQTFQYRNGAIHWEGMTWAAYRETFLKLKPYGNYWQLLSLPDSQLARKGIYVYYPTGEDISNLKEIPEVERSTSLEQEIRGNRLLIKEIERYAKRSDIPQAEAIRMVADRMVEQKLSLHEL